MNDVQATREPDRYEEHRLRDQLAAARAEVERLRAREAELVAGLRPFADALSGVWPSAHDSEYLACSINSAFLEYLVAGHVRRAAALLAKEPTT